MRNYSAFLQVTSEEKSHNFECNNCGKEVVTKHDLMEHRKTVHPKTISECRNFKQGRCSRSAAQCWFSHDEENGQFEKQMDFRNVAEVTIPPEQPMMKMLSTILKKMELLDQRTMCLLS